MKQLTTPVGTALYPRLNTPDTKYNEDGVYSCKLILDKAGYDQVMSQITPWFEAEYERLVKESGKKRLDISTKLPIKVNEDGDYEFNAKQVAQKETKKGLITFAVALVDSAGVKINDAPSIGSGSRLKLCVEPYAYFSPLLGVGYTLRLKAAQILELKEYAGGGSSFGFDAEGGGFVSEDLGSVLENDQKDASIPF